MKFAKILSLLLCASILLNFSLPAAHASTFERIDVENVLVGDDLAAYVYENDAYRYSIVVSTATGNSSFAIMYFKNADYVYEYCFTLDTEDIFIDSAVFWDDLLSHCMSASLTEIYLPTAVIRQENINNSVTTHATNSVESEFVALLEEYFETSEYTGKMIDSDVMAGMRFHVYEDLDFRVEKKDTQFLTTALSVASLITGILQLPITSGLLTALGIAATYILPSGTEIGTHSIGASFLRYVKRADYSRWLNYSECYYSFNGYYISATDHCGIDWDSEEIEYSHSASYFNDTDQQLDDGYYYYSTVVQSGA